MRKIRLPLLASFWPIAILIPSSAFAQRSPALPADDPAWGCYDAAPGHPKALEKRAFVSAIALSAQAAERAGGVPAAGIMAMAALESGFGFTRTAIYANNLFGWKQSGTTGAGGRTSWVLGCQPPSDPGNRYVVFLDAADSVAFVAAKLASLPRYATVTYRYAADRANGLPVDVSVTRWIQGIAAAGYNPFSSYPKRVTAMLSNYAHPGAMGNEADSLLPYSASIGASGPSPLKVAVPVLSAAAVSEAERAAKSYLDSHLERARYLASNCASSAQDWPDYTGREVRRCIYSVTSGGKTLLAVVYLLNPDEENIVARIRHACVAVNLTDSPSCGLGLARLIVSQNGGQFPVAGFVIERKRDAGGSGDDPVYLEFRDGVTVVTTDHLNFTDRQLTVQQMEHAAHAKVVRAQRYARISNADRAAYHRGGGNENVGTGPSDDALPRWPAVIRANELAAQDSGSDMLLDGVAMAMKAALVGSPIRK